MNTPTFTRAIKRLAKRFKDEPAAVLADPLWQQIRALDSSILAKLPAPFRIDLLRHHFMANPEDPWAPLTRVHGEAPTWPTWEVPAWDIGWGSDPKEEEGVLSRRIDLAHGWSFVFAARPAEVRFESLEIYWDDDEDRDDTKFPLDRILTLLFVDPAADPRAALGASDSGASPCNGFGMHGVEVRLYPPNVSEGHDEYAYALLSEDDVTNPDATVIATLQESSGLFRGRADAEGEVRPLFELAPVIDYAQQDDGILTCTWHTTYYVPVEAAPDAEHWWYEPYAIDVVEQVRGASLFELVAYAWDFPTVKDLEHAIGKAISRPSIHQFLVPLYEHVLFVSGEDRRLS
jgi:hypothetical protein